MKRVAARWPKLALGCAATGGFAWLLAHGLDADALAGAFSRMAPWAVVPALAFMAVAHALRIVRWWWMLRALEPGLSLGACARPFLAGMAFNNVLPFRAGDALRVLGFRRQLRSPAARVLGTLVVERALDVIVLCGIFFLGMVGLPEGVMPRGFVVAATWLAGAGMAAILAPMLLSPLFVRIRERRRPAPRGRLRIGRRWPEAVSRHGAHLAEALGVVRSAPRMLSLACLSVVIQACEGAAFVIMAAALEAEVAWQGPWLSMAAGTLATAIPSAPGYVGTFDYFAAQGLAAYGASLEVATACALSVHMLWVPLTAVGLLCWWLPGRDLRPVGKQSATDA